MSGLKCKKCGGEIEFESGTTVGVCKSCGAKQIISRPDVEPTKNAYDQAKDQATASKEAIVIDMGTAVSPLLKRAFLFLEDENWQDADNYCEKVLDNDPENAQAYIGKLMAELHVRRQEDLSNCEQPFDSNNNYQKAIRFGDADLVSVLKGYIKYINERNENARLTGTYEKAVKAMNDANSKAQYRAAADVFKSISGYKDADLLAEECLKKSNAVQKKLNNIIAIIISIIVVAVAASLIINKVILPNAKYNAAKALYDSGRYEEAIAAFQGMNGYRDSAEQIINIENAIKDAKYNAAKALYDSGKYEDAIEAFQEINGYRDSAEQIINIENAIKDAKYNAAKALYDSGKYEDAIEAFQEMNGYKDSRDQIINCRNAIKDNKYNAAKALYDSGKYEEAIEAFKELNGYKDSAEQIDNCYIGKYGDKYNLYKSIKVGDSYQFGKYEQDNNLSNGKEPIEWIVLEKGEMSLLLISRYALDHQYYNTEKDTVTWENCTIRKWLNETFINTAFNMEEQNSIILSLVNADKSWMSDYSPGNNTVDQVFLLSLVEAEKYFSSDNARRCQETAYCHALGYNHYSENYCWWLLRSPGMLSTHTACVSDSGSFGAGNVDSFAIDAVRPALWISLIP